MGNEQSTLQKKNYVIEKDNEEFVVATKGDDKFLIRRIFTRQIPTDSPLISEAEKLKTIGHCHIVNSENSFEEGNIYYVVTDYSHGGSLAAKIKSWSEPPEESQVLSLFVEICMALRVIHEKGLLLKDLTLEDAFLTECGTVRLGGFQKLLEKSQHTTTTTSGLVETSPPEVFTQGVYYIKSDIWSLGCMLYELCTQQAVFSAESTIKLMPKILGGPYPCLPERFSPELHDLLNDIFSKDPQSRPTASEILEHPFIIRCLSEKSKTTVKDLQIKLTTLRGLADSLERVHQGATIGSLAGGVTGAIGGVTSIVGLILAPFTLGASLVVTGVGVGVSVLGGVTAGASNIINMVNQSSDRKAVRSIIKEFEEKISAVVTWVQEIVKSLQTIRNRYNTLGTTDGNVSDLAHLGLRVGTTICATAELIRLVQAMNIGKIAAQASSISSAVRVAKGATGVLTAFLLAVDVFFIAKDAKEVSHIQNAMEDSASEPGSEIMRFVRSIRQAADSLQGFLVELENILSYIYLGGNEGQP